MLFPKLRLILKTPREPFVLRRRIAQHRLTGQGISQHFRSAEPSRLQVLGSGALRESVLDLHAFSPALDEALENEI